MCTGCPVAAVELDGAGLLAVALVLVDEEGVLTTLVCGFPLLELVQALRPRPAMTMVETTAAIRFVLKSSAPQVV